MAHFAKIENNIVTQVIVVGNEQALTEAEGQAFIANTLKLEGTWKQTSYNNNTRKQYAGIGYTYDPVNDVFVAPQPYASWTLDSNHDWQPPTPKPDGDYYWDENLLVWVEYDKQKN